MATICTYTGKQCHATPAAAKKHARGLKARQGYEAVAYRCPACGSFHVGSKKPRMRPIRGERIGVAV